MSISSGAMQRLTRLEKGLAKITLAVTIVTLLAMIFTVFIAVVMRYIFNIALIFSFDVSTVLFAWLVFLGLFVAEQDGAHMGIDISDYFSPFIQRAVEIIRYLLLFATSVYLCKIGISLIERTGTQIPSLRISIRWLYSALPIGFGLLSFSYAIRLVQCLLSCRRKKD